MERHTQAESNTPNNIEHMPSVSDSTVSLPLVTLITRESLQYSIGDKFIIVGLFYDDSEVAR